MRGGNILSVIAAAVTLACASRIANAYWIVDLTPPGAANTLGAAIAGQEAAGQSDNHAWFWNLTTASSVDLHPAGADSSMIFGISPGTQVGTTTTGSHAHAAMWNGTQASYLPLNDIGYTTESSAAAINNGIIVGSGVSSSVTHALVWTSPTNSSTVPVALSTPGTFSGAAYTDASANAIAANRVVGSVLVDSPFSLNHAALWNITNLPAATFTDIHPAAFSDSTATGVAGDQVVGYGDDTATGLLHAIIWQLAGDSVLTAADLNPAGWEMSLAGATNGGEQVGVALNSDGAQHAFRWSGTAASAVDLHAYLPANFVSSQALGITAEGEIIGVATDTNGVVHAIVWAPEPTSLALLALGTSAFFRRRRPL